MCPSEDALFTPPEDYRRDVEYCRPSVPKKSATSNLTLSGDGLDWNHCYVDSFAVRSHGRQAAGSTVQKCERPNMRRDQDGMLQNLRCSTVFFDYLSSLVISALRLLFGHTMLVEENLPFLYYKSESACE